MKRSTVRLIHSIAYRRALAQDLPQLEAELVELLEDGRELRTRRWVARKEADALLLTPNPSPPVFHQIPLTIPQAPNELREHLRQIPTS